MSKPRSNVENGIVVHAQKRKTKLSHPRKKAISSYMDIVVHAWYKFVDSSKLKTVQNDSYFGS